MQLLTNLQIFCVSIGLKIITNVHGIPSNDIDTFVRIFSIRYLERLGFARVFQLFTNPISIIRYFEFDFVRRHVNTKGSVSILDVSSPRIFGLFLCKKNPRILYTMINPDTKDLAETQFQKSVLYLSNMKLSDENALHLPYKTNTFSTVISISVIEHIQGSGDVRAVKEMWRVIKPGGRLILTTHVIKKHRDEYRNIDQYNLKGKKKNGKYFFQRMYDSTTLKKRILMSIGKNPKIVEIIGEKESGWFDEYIARWIKNGIKETVWDPWYIMTKFKTFHSIDRLPGVGVIGLVFEK